MIKRKQNRGLALLWALLLSTVLLIITGIMAQTIIKESQMSINIESSSQAYANARTGVAWAEKYVQDNPAGPGTITKTIDFDTTDPGKNIVDIAINSGVDVISTGTYRGVKRKIHYTLSSNLGRNVNPGNPASLTPVGENINSFEFDFDFWRDNIPLVKNQTIGLWDYGNNFIGAKLDESGKINLTYQGLDRTNGTLKTDIKQLTDSGKSNSPSLPAISGREAYAYRGVLKYKKDTSITLTVFDQSKDKCLGSAVFSVNDIDFGNLSYLYARWTNAPGLPTNEMLYRTGQDVSTKINGDGSYLEGQGYRFDLLMTKGLIASDMFEVNYSTSGPGTITATASPPGSGPYACDGGKTNCYQFIKNMSVTLTANTNANSGSSKYKFSRWTAGPCNDSTSPTCTFTVTSAVTVAAKFMDHTPAYRYSYTDGKNWLWTINTSELGGATGWTDNGIAFYVYPDKFAGSLTLYRLYKNGDRLWTTDTTEFSDGTWTNEGTYYVPSSGTGATTITRLYNRQAAPDSRHFYSTDPETERTNLNKGIWNTWINEGKSFFSY